MRCIVIHPLCSSYHPPDTEDTRADIKDTRGDTGGTKYDYELRTLHHSSLLVNLGRVPRASPAIRNGGCRRKIFGGVRSVGELNIIQRHQASFNNQLVVMHEAPHDDHQYHHLVGQQRIDESRYALVVGA